MRSKNEKKKRFVFNFSDKKSNREVVSKAGESAYFSNTIRRSGNGPKIWRITIYGGELAGMHSLSLNQEGSCQLLAKGCAFRTG